MANEVRFDVVAKDSASKVVDDVADKAAKLEKSDPTVTVDADTRQADHTLDGLDDQLDKLTNADKLVVLSLRAGAASSELSDLATKIATIDKTDPDVDVTFDRYATVAGQLDDLDAKIKSIADADPDAGASLEKARDRLQAVGDEAGKTQGAVHSMAGNALGDFAATATGIGPLGEAIGQLTEQAVGGEAGIKGLATAGLGLGAIGVAMIGVNKVMGEFAERAKKAAEIKAFNTADIDAYVKSIRAGTDAVEDYTAKAEAAGKVQVLATPVGADNLYFANAAKSVQDISDKLADAGVSVRQFATAAQGSDSDLSHFVETIEAMGLSTEATNTLISAATTEHANYATAVDQATKFNKLYAQSVTDTSAATAGLAASAIHADDALADQNATTAKAQTAAENAAGAVERLDGDYQRMSDRINGSQALIDLRDQLDNVHQSGVDAMTAQHDADVAVAEGADNAVAKQGEADAAMRNYQSTVNQLKLDIINLGQTAGMTPVEVQAELDRIDQGDLAGVAADAEAYYRNHPVNVQMRLIGDLTGAAARDFHGVNETSSTTSSAPASITNITNQFLATPTGSRELARLGGRRARITGRG